MKSPDTSIQFLKGIGPRRAALFARAGLNTIEDLLYFFPRRYEDRRNVLPIAKLKEGETAVLRAKILSKRSKQSWYGRGFSLVELTVGDDTGKLPVVWFNQPYLKDYFKVGADIILYGKIRTHDLYLQMVSPEFEVAEENDTDSLDIGRIVPVYRAIEGVSQRYVRGLMHNVLKQYLSSVHDALPFSIRKRQNLFNLAKSLLEIHFPEDIALQQEAYRRLAFEEFFLFIIPVVLRKLKSRQKKGLSHNVEGELVKKFEASLPFKLTKAQQRVIGEIKEDMAKTFPMHRLLEGDVASGKTIVAVYSAVIAIENGYQAAFMAPTEILAKQHFEKVSAIGGSAFGGRSQQKKINISLLVGSLDKKEKE
ncbi:MAG: DNA helicase RecG, partial [Candidatus Omnitrophica bacterium]|nr:DNA helicase RecG [Candidatus Omnitrophota bacterium]